MLPQIWGKYGWNFIHLITVSYPINPTKDDKINYFNYFYWLQKVLPCEKCRYNMLQHLQKYPLSDTVLSCKENLIKWGIDLHNAVNYSNGKPILSYYEAIENIENLMKEKSKDGAIHNYFYLIIIGLIIVILILIFVILGKKN